MNQLLIALGLAFVFFSCSNPSTESAKQPPKVESQVSSLNYQLVGSLPHDVNSFTEGLFIHKGELYESTGSPADLPNTFSHFGIVDTTNGSINVKASLDKNRFFGEGISILNGKLYQLTYKAQICFIYDATTFKLLSSAVYDNAEGWGLTHNNEHLIMSDGTSMLTFFEPQGFTKVKQLKVKENGVPVKNINELEYVDGFIYANVWMTNTIIKIDPTSGDVVAKRDFGELYQNAAQSSQTEIMEMNGIAYDSSKKEFLITGKLWPKIYRVKLM